MTVLMDMESLADDLFCAVKGAFFTFNFNSGDDVITSAFMLELAILFVLDYKRIR